MTPENSAVLVESGLPLGVIPALRDTSFQCFRCRTSLQVAASDPIPILAASVVFTFGLCVALGLRGFVFTAAIVGTTGILYWLGKLVRSLIANPTLEKAKSSDTLLASAKRIHPSASGRSTSLRAAPFKPSVIKVSWFLAQNGYKPIRTNQDPDFVRG
jgi:hypothetical protein